MKAIETYLMPNAYHVVFIDGYFASEFSVMPKNFICIAEVNHIEFPENYRGDKPVQFVFCSSATQQAEKPLQNIIHVKNSAEVVLLETYVGNIQQYTHTIQTKITVACDAKMNYYKYQNEGKQATHQADVIINQQANSTVQAFNFSYGGQSSSDHLTIHLLENDAECQVYGLYCAQNQQHMNYCTHIEHHARQGRSTQLYKGIIADKAIGDFAGKIVVQPQAQNTWAHQKNHNLLLSKEAIANTKPELAIYADDVQCTHGATVGQLDEEALFYLCSRGIAPVEARQLLVDAFAGEVTEIIADAAVKQYLLTLESARKNAQSGR